MIHLIDELINYLVLNWLMHQSINLPRLYSLTYSSIYRYSRSLHYLTPRLRLLFHVYVYVHFHVRVSEMANDNRAIKKTIDAQN